MGMQRLTAYGGGAGSLLRLFVLAVIMLPIVAVVMLRARVPEAQAALTAFRGWLGAKAAGAPAAKGAPRPGRPSALSPERLRPFRQGSTNVAARKSAAPDQVLRPGHRHVP